MYRPTRGPKGIGSSAMVWAGWCRALSIVSAGSALVGVEGSSGRVAVLGGGVSLRESDLKIHFIF